MLERLGYQVDTASNGEQAMHLFAFQGSVDQYANRAG